LSLKKIAKRNIAEYIVHAHTNASKGFGKIDRKPQLICPATKKCVVIFHVFLSTNSPYIPHYIDGCNFTISGSVSTAHQVRPPHGVSAYENPHTRRHAMRKISVWRIKILGFIHFGSVAEISVKNS
jgi:hypothetical protein